MRTVTWAIIIGCLWIGVRKFYLGPLLSPFLLQWKSSLKKSTHSCCLSCHTDRSLVHSSPPPATRTLLYNVCIVYYCPQRTIGKLCIKPLPTKEFVSFTATKNLVCKYIKTSSTYSFMILTEGWGVWLILLSKHRGNGEFFMIFSSGIFKTKMRETERHTQTLLACMYMLCMYRHMYLCMLAHVCV